MVKNFIEPFLSIGMTDHNKVEINIINQIISYDFINDCIIIGYDLSKTRKGQNKH